MHKMPSPSSMGMTGKVDHLKCVKIASHSKVWAWVVAADLELEASVVVAALAVAVALEDLAGSVVASPVDLEVAVDSMAAMAVEALMQVTVVVDTAAAAETMLLPLNQTLSPMALVQMARKARSSSSAMFVILRHPSLQVANLIYSSPGQPAMRT